MVVVDLDRTDLVPSRDEIGAEPCSGATGPAAAGPAPSVRRPDRWHPLAGVELLDRLRVTGRRRPLADPDLEQRLRSALDHGLLPEVADPVVGGPEGPPLVVTKDRLTRALACEAHAEPTGFGDRTPTTGLACGALIDVLFRQLVTVGALGDPMADGLAALGVDDRQRPLVDWIERLPPAERGELESEVVRQARGLECRWPALEPSWLPRTQEVLRARVARGTVELSARVDLAIGRPAVDEASVALVEVKSGARSRQHRADLHFYALVETLRNSVPPFVVATYYTRTGELDVEPVTEDLLSAAVRRTVVGTRTLRELERGVVVQPPGGLCGRCTTLPGWGMGRAAAAGAGPEQPREPAGPQPARHHGGRR
jgi:hypothetical protein